MQHIHTCVTINLAADAKCRRNVTKGNKDRGEEREWEGQWVKYKSKDSSTKQSREASEGFVSFQRWADGG